MTAPKIAVQEKHQVEARRTFVTPEVAYEILVANTMNRTLSPNRVKVFADYIRDGKWMENGSSITIAWDGRLLDGQHRLHAIVDSGIGVWALVVRGVDPGVFPTIDTGKSRSSSDVLSIKGHKNTTLLAATLGMLGAHDAGGYGSPTAMRQVDMDEMIERHPEVADSVDFVAGLSRPRGIGGSIAACAHALFSRRDRDEADRMIIDVMRGANLSAHDPVYLLRARLLDEDFSVLARRWTALSLYIQAWNARRRGLSPHRLLGWRAGDRYKFPQIED